MTITIGGMQCIQVIAYSYRVYRAYRVYRVRRAAAVSTVRAIRIAWVRYVFSHVVLAPPILVVIIYAVLNYINLYGCFWTVYDSTVPIRLKHTKK